MRSTANRSSCVGHLWVALGIVALGMVSVRNEARASQIVREQFLTGANPSAGQYNTAASLIGQNPSIAGFSGGWYSSSGSSMNVNAGSLSYSNPYYSASSGGRLFSNETSNRVHRLFDATLNPFQASSSGTIYLSFLFQQASTGSLYTAFEMHNGGNNDSFRTFQIGVSPGTDFPVATSFGYRVNNSVSRALGPRNTDVNLFLVKFSLSTSNNGDSVTVWQNPTLTSLLTDPVGGVTASGFNLIADRLGVGRFGGTSAMDFSFDELRIGTTLGEVLSDTFRGCDVNGNGVCNSTDMRIISDNMFKPGGLSEGDINGDGFVDFSDFRLFKDDPNRVAGFDPAEIGHIQVPEPSAISILPLGIVAISLIYGRRKIAVALALLIACGFAVNDASAQSHPLPPVTTFSGATLHMKRYTSIPTTPIISMTTQPLNTGNENLFVTTQNGSIYSVDQNGNPSLFFNYNAAVGQFVSNPSNGFVLDTSNATHGGLRNISFHPEFALNGKFYTSALVDSPSGVSGLRYLGPQLANPAAESLVAEWTYDRVTNQVTGYRELFRVRMPVFDHPIKQMGFNNFAKPGDEDYGLLYIAHGDGSQFSTTVGGGAPDNALGKILRVNPLQDGPNPYTIPDNVLAGVPGYLPEIYTLGHRNPHHLSFARDADGNTHIIVAEPGRDNIEEVNVLHNGGNYGWSSREGTWVQLPGTGGYGVGVGIQNLPANEWQNNDFIYPAAQYGHTNANFGDGFVGISIAGGFTIQNNSDPALQDQYIFLNHANGSGDVYQADLYDLIGAHTQLADGELPSALTQAPISRLHLTLDVDGNGTIDRTNDNLNTLLQVSRNDSRFGRGPNGEMFISSKSTGQVYLVTNTVPDVDRLQLTVDRTSGEMTITNPSGENIEINRMSLTSLSGSIVPMELEPIAAGWSVTGATSHQNVTQANPSGTFIFNDETVANLGDAYKAKLLSFGGSPGEDVVFVFDTPDGDSFLGEVVYTGESKLRNTIVMTINIATGEAVLLNETPFSQEVEGYTVVSNEGLINTAGWNSFQSQGIADGDWFASPADANRLTELQDLGTTTFDENTPYSIGEIYTVGAEQDLEFQFLLAGEENLRDGVVVYVLPGDFDNDLDVDGRDFLIWQRGGSPKPLSAEDLAAWQAHYGFDGSALVAAATVPEPGGALLALLSTVGIFARRVAQSLPGNQPPIGNTPSS